MVLKGVNMISKISVFGLGKLGCSMLAVFADKGFQVNGYDLDKKKVLDINEGKAPVYETGLEGLISKNKSKIRAFSDPDGILNESQISFIIVPTPSKFDDTFETKYAENAARTIGQELRDHSDYHVVVLTSTVLPGDSRKIIISILEQESKKKCGQDFGFCYSPEFIALGSVIEDLQSPDYFLIGQYDEKSGDMLEHVNKKVASKKSEMCRMTIEEAELAKIATNSYITMKISFANYMSNLCEKIPGASVDVVTNAIGRDSRIGSKYLKGGMAYGGPCFPRDNKALGKFALNLGVKSFIQIAVDEFNKNYSEVLADRVSSNILSSNKKIGVLGVSYKPNSHLIEESPSMQIINRLKQLKCEIYYFDKLQNEFQIDIDSESVIRVNSVGALISVADVIILAHNDASLINDVQIELSKVESKKTVIDCWRILGNENKLKVNIVKIGAGNY